MDLCLLIDAHSQRGHHPSRPLCSVISIFDLVREKEETPCQCTAGGSNSYGFCRLSLVRNSDGPPAIAIVPACDVADFGLDALRLTRP
jgi:hypothetical protein